MTPTTHNVVTIAIIIAALLLAALLGLAVCAIMA